jgi:hypothetical protein
MNVYLHHFVGKEGIRNIRHHNESRGQDGIQHLSPFSVYSTHGVRAPVFGL